MTTTTNRLPTSLTDAVATLEPVIRRHAGDAEQNRVMAPEIMEALVASGLLRMWVPQAYGGLEADPNESLDVMEQLSRIDAATGWVVSNCVFISTLPQFLPEPVRARIAGDPAIVACGTFVPPGTARATADGYILNGDWSFGSATQYATSIATLVLLVDDAGELILQGGNPVSIVAYFSRDDVEFRDTWFTLGLRATGSTNFVAKDLAIPKECAYVLGPWEQKDGAFAGPLYRLGLIMDAVRIAKVGVGIAQGAVDDFVELATRKTPAYTAALTADRATVQERVARAQALVQAGRHTIRTSVTEGWASVQDGSRITGERCLPMGLAASFALDAATQAVDLLYQSGGTTAFRDESPLQRRFRDIQTLRQNAIASWSRYESLGKMILGRPSDWPFHQL
jgi:alkylation response protein AidB-like acyl-CoA dehydrogenase